MCGIAAIVESANLPPIQDDWPFWDGVSSNASLIVHGDDCILQSQASSSMSTMIPAIHQLLPALQLRGPDATQVRTIQLTEEIHIRMVYTVLSLRGIEKPPSTLTPGTSPESEADGEVWDAARSLLLFNGEIYDGFPTDGDKGDACLNDRRSDTVRLYEELEQYLSSRNEPAQDDNRTILKLLDRLKGPWAIIFWHASSRRLYFGRDVLGRRSLLVSTTAGSHLAITSVSPVDDMFPQGTCNPFTEIAPIGIAFLDLSNARKPSFGLYPRSRTVIPAPTGAHPSIPSVVSFLHHRWFHSMTAEQRIENGIGTRDVAIADMCTDSVAEKLLHLLRQSVRRRLATSDEPRCDRSRFALLFSGGVDSMVLARLLDDVMPVHEPLPLVNVGFGDNAEQLAQCPDRIAAVAGAAELRALSKTGRNINLLAVDVDTKEARRTRDSSALRGLLWPSGKELMDASIGTALVHAVRAAPARIVISGIGADEMMAGYKGRHRNIFRRQGMEGLRRELDADLSRLWWRNLGRDDRIVAAHGKEVRQPFLDEDVVEFVTGLPVTPFVCDLALPDGVGDKRILRRVAELLGLSHETVRRTKRAMQFGSRSKHVLERKGGG